MESNLYTTLAVFDQNLLDRLNALRQSLGFMPINEYKNSSWLIVENKSKTDIGYIRVVPFSDNEREIGFVLLPEFRGKGVMSSVLPDFVKRLNESLYTETSDENKAAIKLLRKSGFMPTKAEHEFHTTPSGESVRTVAFRYTQKN